LVDGNRTLGRTDLQVPSLGAGVMAWGQPTGLGRFTPATLAYGGTSGPEDERQAFEASLAAGVTLFDTAPIYSRGASERRLGELAAGTPALVATKFPPSFRGRTDDLPGALEASLARLQRRTVDLYQHHFPSRRVDTRRLMHLMADAVTAGKVRAVGVSNYSADQMRLAHSALAERGVVLASNQVQYSLLHRKPETDGVLDACRELGVTLIAYQPLASGALTGKYLTGPRPRGLRRFMPYFRRSARESLVPVIELLREIGATHGTGPAQVALRWLLEDDAVLPIPGAKHQAQAIANAQALTFELAPDEVDALAAATRAWRR
jgi:aryl-alcohol dehydrogenase-like predicted oxidoreductase